MDINQNNAFRELMEIRGKGFPAEGEVTVTGQDPFYASPLKIGETTAGILAARAVAANDIWEMKKGRRQKIQLDVHLAAATNLGGTDQTKLEDADGTYKGIESSPAMKHMVEMTQPWECADGRWYLPHFNLPHLEKRVLGVLGAESTAESVKAAVKKFNSLDLDRAIADVHATGGLVFTPEEWLQHPHGKHLNSLPVVVIEKAGESAPVEIPAEGDQPLSGLRVLELCRILAGPTCGISLAEHGADVLMVTAPQLPQVPGFVRDVSHGKRSCYLDYTIPEQAQQLHELAKSADIFVQGYRPASMERHGFGLQEMIKERPGLIYVSIDCYGPGGVYSDRAGWDQCAQALTGMAVLQGQAEGAGQPKLTPCYTCDFLTGFMGAYGAMLALAMRAKEGGSYHVHVSLCQSAMLLLREGLIEDFSQAPGKLTDKEYEPYAVYDNGTVYGNLKTLGPVIRMSESNPRWDKTTPELGSTHLQPGEKWPSA